MEFEKYAVAPQSVADEVSGMLVPHGNVEAWMAAMRRIASDGKLRERLQAGAIEFAARFSWDRTADETEAHLQEVLSRGPGSGRSLVNSSLVEVT